MELKYTKSLVQFIYELYKQAHTQTYTYIYIYIH